MVWIVFKAVKPGANMILKKWLRRSWVTLTLALLAANAWGQSKSNAGDSTNGAKSEAPAVRHAEVNENKIVLPEYYGVSAIDGGKTMEVSPAKEPLDFSGDVEFILYDKLVAGARSDLRLYRVSAVGIPRQAGATEIPSDGTIVDTHAKPVRNQPEMIRVIPVTTLEPGLYQFTDRVRFFVRKSELKTGPLVGTWIQDSPVGAAVIRFGMDGTYKMSIFSGDKKHPSAIRESGTWTLNDKQLKSVTTAAADGRPAGTVDIVEIVKLDEQALIFRDPATKSVFAFQRPSADAIKGINALERGEVGDDTSTR
jgi:hypothetical protein